MTRVALQVGPAMGSEIRPLHGVNNGPVTYGGLVDVTELYRAAAIPFVRLHDPNWPHAWEVDIHTIFPDFTRDPRDPASYDFNRTDDYLATVVATGARVVYRLGESIEHTRRKYFVHPPADPAVWAGVCLGIIRHYNEGWADGFEYGIQHWEIWNEPDNPDGGVMWSGTDDEYFELYAVSALAIKSAFPQLKVGGPACTMINEPHTREFLRRCRDDALPLDFFSWHTYADGVGSVADNAAVVEGWLDEYGFGDIEIHLNEWNHTAAVDLAGDPVETRRYLFERLKGAPGASFAAGVLCALQDSRVAIANYYDGQPRSWYCGLFDDYGAPLATYRVFEEFSRLAGLPRANAAFQGEPRGMYALAARRDGALEVLLVNPTAKAVTWSVSGLDPQAVYVAFEIGNPLAPEAHPVHDPSAILTPAHSVTLLRTQR